MNMASTVVIYGGGPGSGCQGPNCGRHVVLYHGTAAENVDSIRNEGLKEHNPYAQTGHDKTVSLTSDVNTAHKYGYVSSPTDKYAVISFSIPQDFADRYLKNDPLEPKSWLAHHDIPKDFITGVKNYTGDNFKQIWRKQHPQSSL